MATAVAAFATSHASAFMAPETWDAFRAKIRAIYRERFGTVAAEPAEVGRETELDSATRYRRITDVHDLIRARLAALAPDVVIVLGNDQNENYDARAVPQFAIYTGGEMVVDDHLVGRTQRRGGHPALARSLVDGLVAQGFDVVQSTRFDHDTLRSHAHAQVLTNLVPDGVAVVPVFVNAITPPLPSTGRCFAFGGALATALDRADAGLRVVLATSGGLSHFTAGYPYELLSEPRVMGSICADFDREMMAWVAAGDLGRIATLTDQSLLDHGDVEFRQSIAFFGALPRSVRPAALAYEPIYRSLIGMWAGYWELGPA